MSRWVAFDDKTAAAVAAAAHVEPVLSPATDYLDEVLSVEGECVLVMPAVVAGKALVAQFRHPEPAPTPTPREEPGVHYEATGFLGLMDTPVYEDEPRREKRKWWRRKS